MSSQKKGGVSSRHLKNGALFLCESCSIFLCPQNYSSGMHSGDLVKLGGSDLTEVEKGTLLEVMQRAKV